MKIYHIFCLILVFGVNIAYSQYPGSWQGLYSNNGSGWISGWHIDTYDKYHKMEFPSSGGKAVVNYKVFNTNYQSGWWAIMDFNGSSWNIPFSNGGSGGVTVYDSVSGLPTVGFTLRSSAIYLPLSYTPNQVIMIMMNRNDGDKQTTIARYNSVNGKFYYLRNYGHRYLPGGGGWTDHNSDKYVIGNFDNSDIGQELLCVSSQIGLVEMYDVGPNSPWPVLYSNGSGSIPGWIIRWDDFYWAADLQGDSKDELICYNAGTGWSTVYKFENGNWVGIWTNGGNNQIGIGGFINGELYDGDLNNCGKEEILFISPSTKWATVKSFSTSTYWPDYWSNLGQGNPPSIGYWGIGNGDKYLVLGDKFFSTNVYNGWSQVHKFNYSISCADVNDNLNINSKNYPNPFNPVTIISYNVPKATDVSVVVYNSLGKEVQRLVNKFQQIGSYDVAFDGSNLSSGVYFYKITAGDFVETKRMMLIK